MLNSALIFDQAPRSYTKAPLPYILKTLGLWTSVVWCVDIADLASYSGSGQTLTDLSGNANNFTFGATSGAEASDPTFTGTAGSLDWVSTYGALDGGDYWRIGANVAATDAFHKAAAKFTILQGMRNAGAVAQGIFGDTAGTGTHVGIDALHSSSSGAFSLSMRNGSATQVVATSTAFGTGTGDAVYCVSENEGAGASNSFAARNRVSFLYNGNYTSPSAAAATDKMELCAVGSAASPVPNLGRFYFSIALSTNISLAQYQAFHNAVRIRGSF